MTKHRLDPLLKPNSVALVGASDRSTSPGYVLADMVINSNFSGEVFTVNPGYQTILGKPCYADLDSLPVTVDHVVIALGTAHLEKALADAIKHGAKAATLYSGTVLDEDTTPNLAARLTAMARKAGLQICGANGMGFYNVRDDFYPGLFPRPGLVPRGGISLIAQSGTAFGTFAHNGCRLGFNLCVSSGNEMTTTSADYLDWSLEQEDTRVIGLFLETVRDPTGFVAALVKASQKNIPVVILKIGKSPRAVEMALTHTGAIAGDHSAFEALFKRHGVIEVSDFDEMAATLMLLQTGREAAIAGREAAVTGLAAVFESGGLRELFTDQAHQLEVEFATICESTAIEMEKHLDPGLKPENPLDAWGQHVRFEERFLACFDALMQDPNVAGGAFVSIFRDDYYLHEAIYRVVETVSKRTSKPVALITTYADVANATMCQRAFNAGIPLIDGSREALLAFKHLFRYQQFKLRSKRAVMTVDATSAKIASDRQKLASFESDSIGETDALQLLAEYSIPVVEHCFVFNQLELVKAANSMKYPLVLKTAEPGINHKSDCNGVFINIQNEAELLSHYQDLSNRLGDRALLSKMVDQGVEIALGVFNDAQFGPMIIVAAGGILVELIEDRSVAMCPVDQTEAAEMLSALKISQLLDGVRGRAAINRQSLIDAIVKTSEFAYLFRDSIAEIDINPILVNAESTTAVDALIIRKPIQPPC
jgi:acyl-CoA synthetase (NDP forming)